jgi:hypothetical protein
MGAAARKWFSLAADIVVFEFAHWDDAEMLSDATHRWVGAHPVAARLTILSAGALITAHLAALLEPAHDPLSKEFRFRNGRRTRVAGIVMS